MDLAMLSTRLFFCFMVGCNSIQQQPATKTETETTTGLQQDLYAGRRLGQLLAPAPAPEPWAQLLSTTGTADNLRTGWYPDQPALTPALVGQNDFGQLFQLKVDGAIYAQPLVVDNVLLIVTETNQVYGFDATDGQLLWRRDLGAPWDPKAIGCGDLVPTVGITSTPVVDHRSETIYLLAKTYDETATPIWLAHGLDLYSGQDRPNFPVEIAGQANNDPNILFNANVQMQRPALLLLDDVIYAGFGGHCDYGTYYGFIVGIDTDGTLRTIYSAAVENSYGAGIWQSGGGLVSDGPGQILFTTGNGYNTDLGEAPIVGSNPPANLAQSVVRVVVQPDGHLLATDFFMPADAAALDSYDADLGSGSPVALPSDVFGTTANPNLLVQVGKGGRLMLLDRDNLGGFRTGANLGDNVVSELSIDGGFWGRPSVWSANGGFVYLVPNGGPLQAYAYSQDGQGKASLVLAANSIERFGYTTGSPIITSSDSLGESGLVWLIGTRGADGAGGVLRAYDALPTADGQLTLRFAAAIGQAAKFAPPGVGHGRIYVGTRDGNVFCFGSPVPTPVRITAPPFPATTVACISEQSLTITAQEAVSLIELTLESSDFVISQQETLPKKLNPGESLSIAISFTPTAPGPTSAGLTIQTDKGPVQHTLAGLGIACDPLLVSNRPALSFAGTTLGQSKRQGLTLTNFGAQPYVFTAITLPDENFTITGLPSLQTTLEPQASIAINVLFSPEVAGSYVSELVFGTGNETTTIGLTGTAATTGQLAISPMLLDFGQVALEQRLSKTITLNNLGDSPLLIQRSKAPSKGIFIPITPLDEGTVIAPGQSVLLTISFQPIEPIDYFDEWSINTNDGQGVRQILLQGIGFN